MTNEEIIEQLKGYFPKGGFVNMVEMGSGDGYSDFMILVPFPNGIIGDLTHNVAKSQKTS